MLKWYSNVSGTSHEAEIQRPAVRQRRLWPYLFALSLLPAAAAQEQTISPAQALAFDSGQPITARALEQAVREGDPWEQLDWTFTLRPSLLYRQYLDERGGDDLSPRLSSTLQVRFSETPLQAVQRAGRLERALRAHDRAKRLEKRDALLAFAELLLAQDAFTLAAASLNNLAPDASQLERQGAELDLRIEEAGLNAARLAAAKFGMYGTAQYHPIRFVVPAAPRVRNLSDYRAQELVLAEAETRYLAAGGAGVLRDFRLGVGYRTDGMEVDFEAGLMAGRPGLRLGTIHPGGRARMDVRVSAELATGDSLRELPRLKSEVEIAQADLDYLADELWARWLAASLEAEFAESTLTYEEALLEEANESLAAVSSALASLPDDAENERRPLEVTKGRAEREVQRLSTRVYRAWSTYVRRHHDMLEAAGATWSQR